MNRPGSSYGFFPGCAYGAAAGYRESVEAVNRRLNVRLVEIADWNCCGATSIFSLNHAAALTITGRLFALAQKQGHGQIVTVCNACYTTLRKAGQEFEQRPDELQQVNAQLAREDLWVEHILPVRHYLEVLFHDIPAELWARHPSSKLGRIRVAAYYGCQLSRPWGDIDHPERPRLLDLFLERIGFQVVDHSGRTQCCGASHALPYEAACRPLIRRIVEETRRRGADLISTLCPLCQFNLDTGQDHSGPRPIPIPYFSQLAGLALGISPEELGFEKLLTPIGGLTGTLT